MITALVRWGRKLRRALSRSEWTVRLLNLPSAEQRAPRGRGLVLCQIDGLPRSELQRAIDSGRMPFLARLLRREQYNLVHHYPGQPSTTPAVQGEILYGVKSAVPAFQFRDSESGQVGAMYDPSMASRVQQRLEQQGRGILDGGTAYADIYSAGAEESSWCPASFGLGQLWKKANPIRLAAVMALHFPLVARVAALSVAETALAFRDVLAGVTERRDLLEELRFVPSRVGICLVMRELIAMGARADVARGVPIVHCNFLGYDEQAHRRGPDSAFAHWTLSGIDAAIEGIARAAERSDQRHYDLWVYSDHGQEPLDPYARRTGRSVQDAAAEVLEDHGLLDGQGSHPLAPPRASLFGDGFWGQILSPDKEHPSADGLVMPAMGPVGHLYLPAGAKLDRAARADLAGDLIDRAGIPMVLAPVGEGRAEAWTADGHYDLPEQGRDLLGERTYIDELQNDLTALTHHRDAGDLLIVGWSPHGRGVSFAAENGSHAGPGPGECDGFLLAPPDAPLQPRPGGYIRPMDLHEAIGRFMNNGCDGGQRRPRESHFRLMTYNVHSCIGSDGRHSPERIARVIARHAPDVVALQELDVGHGRSEGVHHAEQIAELLEMRYHFHPSLKLGAAEYGTAILSRFDMEVIRAERLPGPTGLEPRAAVWVRLATDDGPVDLLATHLGLRPRERTRQMQALLGPDWLGSPDALRRKILCGDLNSPPSSRPYRLAAARLTDAHAGVIDGQQGQSLASTWLGWLRLDHVFVGDGLLPVSAEVPATRLARLASDHRPLTVELKFADEAEEG